MIAKRVRCKVFLEGVEIPFNSVSLSMGPGAPNVLTLNLTPVKSMFDIRPRTLVQVFYDNGEGFRNFFEGEVVGHGYSKTSQGRAMTLTCLDLANYWIYSYAFYLNLGQTDILSLSMNDEVQLFTGADATQVSQRRDNERVFPLRGIGDKVSQLFVRKTDMVGGIRDILKFVQDVNEFYAARFAGLRLSERLVSLKDDQAQFLLDPSANEILRYVILGQPSYAPVLQVVGTLLDLLYQTFWSLSLPSVDSDTGKPVSFAIVPPTFLTAPPRCNVIFPDLLTGFSYGRQFMEEPTRLDLLTGSAGDNGEGSGLFKQFEFAPAELRAKIKEITTAQAQNKDLRLQNILIKSSNPEIDESSKGIIPERRSLQLDVFSQVRAAILRSQKDKATADEYAKKVIERTIAQVADYEFLRRKFQSRRFSAEMPFNPNLHPAFPVLLLDSEANIFGSPDSIVHTISGEGQATTLLQCSFARNKDVAPDVISSPPPWINKSYVPEAIGEDTYAFLDIDGKSKTVQGAYPRLIGAGHRSILSQELPVFSGNGQSDTKKPASQEEAAGILMEVYKRSGDKDAFVQEYTRRPVQTMEQALTFMGMTKVNDELLDGTLYDPVKRSVIEDAKAKLVAADNAISEV